MLQPHDQVGPYILVKYLGSGAFGEVWLAEKRTAVTTIQVALKLPKKSDVKLETVRQEAAIWEQAKGHPNVLPLIDADIYQVGGREYVGIASEYADGGSLRDWLDENGGKAPSMQAAIEMCAGILSGLAHLHSRNIVHRDLKPENIMLQGGTPRLTDFGLARVLKDGVSSYSAVSGTPLYMAPEAFDGKRSAKSDIWSAGVILYQMLTGRLPFASQDMMALMKAILMDAPAPLPVELPENLRSLVTQALQKETDQRLASASYMRGELLKTKFTGHTFIAETDTVIDLPAPSGMPTLATIRSKMLTAHSAWELREALLEVEQFLGRNPHHPEGQMLRENINRALTREAAMAQPQAVPAAYQTQAPMSPPPMAKSMGFGKLLAGGGLVAALLIGVISISLISSNRAVPDGPLISTNANTAANTNRPVLTNANHRSEGNVPFNSNLPANIANTRAVNANTPRINANANTNANLPASGTVLVSVPKEIQNRVVILPRPDYPAIAIKWLGSGAVKVRVTIDAQGTVTRREIISGPPLLQSAALDAARQAGFSSGPETVSVITYEFSAPLERKKE